jgi:hypothetical protein
VQKLSSDRRSSLWAATYKKSERQTVAAGEVSSPVCTSVLMHNSTVSCERKLGVSMGILVLSQKDAAQF